MAQTLRVNIVGDASSLSRALGQANKSTSKLGRALGIGLKAGVAAAGAGLVGLGIAAKIGFDEFSQAAKVTAQTNAVLKSTGGVANVTAKGVKNMSEALMMVSGVDDEVIQSGQNMLLTFTQIQNKMGKGNQIFDQATRATLDLSVAMDKDMASSAILVGKALNDPIKGLTSLTRVGVKFTDAQREQIKRMVEAGDVMGAQKIILKELNTEFGGSAEAVGKTLPGQLNILKESFQNAMGEAMTALVPFIERLVEWANKHMPEIQAKVTAAMTGIATVVAAVATFIDTHWGTVMTVFNAVKGAAQTVVQFFRDNWPEISRVTALVFDFIVLKAQEVIAWYNSDFKPAMQNVLGAIKGFWDKFGADIMRVVQTTFGTIFTIVRNTLNIIKGVVQVVLAVLRGDWSAAWNALKDIAKNALGNVVALIKGFKDNFLTVAKALGGALKDGIVAGVQGLADLLGRAVKGALNAVISAWNGLEFSLPGFDPPGPGPKFGGVTIGTPNVPYLASGVRNFRGGLSVVGERGPELVNLPRGSDVYRHGQGPAGGTYIAQLIVDGKLLAEATFDPMRNKAAQFKRTNGKAAF